MYIRYLWILFINRILYIKKGMVTLQVNDKRSQGVDNSHHIKLFKNLLVFHCHFCYNKFTSKIERT